MLRPSSNAQIMRFVFSPAHYFSDIPQVFAAY